MQLPLNYIAHLPDKQSNIVRAVIAPHSVTTPEELQEWVKQTQPWYAEQGGERFRFTCELTMSRDEARRLCICAVGGIRGAPMGRHSSECTTVAKWSFSVDIDKGGYDRGGAYWGIPCAPDYEKVYCVISEFGQTAFTRAKSASHAKKLLARD